MMTISVLMSVYKNERSECLDEALASVWTAQTVKPQQIVLVEDGPLTDGLYETIEKWKRELGDVLLVLANVQNLGLTKSLNIGLSHVTSDLVARMDSDDISMPKRFEMQVKYLEDHPDVSVVGGAMQEFNSENPCVNV
ncbi:MAG: glycosyltransferase, partial [Prevotella sp.]|nr:glycosyltransferase [Prevotella sp.]